MMFTEQELLALKRLIHLAVLHSGMEVAEMAVVLNRKVDMMMNQRGAQPGRPAHLPPKPNGHPDAQTSPDQVDG
jgi:hypothetical protein